MKVVAATEDADGMVTASVELDDGFTQTVILPSWATKANFIAEAKRLAGVSAEKERKKKRRTDLED